MTWEHPAHRYLKRAKADQIAFGTPGAHRSALADLVDLPGRDARPGAPPSSARLA
jgi:alkylation response protein AidB-like acyl-CoA dehydrogenase